MSSRFRKTSPVLKQRLDRSASPKLGARPSPDVKLTASPVLTAKHIEFGDDDAFQIAGLGDDTRASKTDTTTFRDETVTAAKVKGVTPAEDFDNIGIFDIYKIGVGPSSSHTNAPMVAGHRFGREVELLDLMAKVKTVKCDLYGSLALTGKGHRTDTAVILGLMGEEPPTCDVETADAKVAEVDNKKSLKFNDDKYLYFDREQHLIFHMDIELPLHPNGMTLEVLDSLGHVLHKQTYYSIGGGFIKTEKEMLGEDVKRERKQEVPYPFRSCVELFKVCVEEQITVAEVMMANEAAYSCGGNMDLVVQGIDRIADTMFACIQRGLREEGGMPGNDWPRQAKRIHNELQENPERMLTDHFVIMDYVALWARAANEENACGGRVVTAPTNGAAGTIPAVLYYYHKFMPKSSREGIRTFLATAAAVGSLLKRNATISGAEGGCQAEVGSACCMAAAGLAAVSGGGLSQIESAAEIGLEHNLGMTCDPLDGLVQVPCIERNSIAAIKAITSARMARRRGQQHLVSLDSCIETMYRTGKDIAVQYRETSLGGLAVLAKLAHPFEPAAYAGY